jgi:hypothetical protein
VKGMFQVIIFNRASFEVKVERLDRLSKGNVAEEGLLKIESRVLAICEEA